VELLRYAGGRKPVAVDNEAGLSRGIADALDGKLPSISPAFTFPYGIEASCDEHALLFAGLLQAR
jgi:hypothetical protein